MKEILGIGAQLIDKLFPDKAKAAQAKAELVQLQQAGDLKEIETRMSVMMAEAQSKDPWTSRARPAFMYVMYIMILASIPMGVLSFFNPEAAQGIAEGMKQWLAAIPSAMWSTFGIGYSGYAIARSMDKRQLKKNA